MRRTEINEQSPLSLLVCGRLQQLGLKQSEFCRKTGFDQGLLSKIQGSIITNLSLESVLRLSVGLRIPPTQILGLIDRMDLHELVLEAYEAEQSVLARPGSIGFPADIGPLASTASADNKFFVKV
ncbi:MAG TPA: helix-turn-helix domain-containing protein [Blastocatellia bacterium]|nr:helix-turn-helix domain-containing protein [Blastocatellia bacterium]